MSLLKRIAVSNGDKARKAEAHKAIARMNQAKIRRWHQDLQAEICQKQKARSALHPIIEPSGRCRTATERKPLQSAIISPASFKRNDS